MEVTISVDDVTDWTCVDCASKIGGTFILEKVTDADCYYTFCENDPCNGVSDLGETYLLKLLVFLTDTAGSLTVEVYAFFGVTNTSCNSSFDGLRQCHWSSDLGTPVTANCLDFIDHDLSPVANDTNVDLGFCHAGVGSVHVRALN
jgi:hypothetical protein